MAAKASLLVRPGSPSVPEFVDIDGSGLDTTKTVELLVNGVVRATVPVDVSGNAVLTFTVPAGPIQTALTDLIWCECLADVKDATLDLCRIETELGDSMALRYQA